MSEIAADIAAVCRHGIAAAAGQRGWDDTRESWLARAARRLGWSYRRTRGVWHGEARKIEAAEYLRCLAEIEANKAATEAARENQDATERAFLAAGRAIRAATDDLREPEVPARGRASIAASTFRPPR